MTQPCICPHCFHSLCSATWCIHLIAAVHLMGTGQNKTGISRKCLHFVKWVCTAVSLWYLHFFCLVWTWHYVIKLEMACCSQTMWNCNPQVIIRITLIHSCPEGFGCFPQNMSHRIVNFVLCTLHCYTII